LDLSVPQAIQPVLAGSRPDVVINCAAYNYVDRAEDEPEAALAVNTLAVRRLAQVCRDLDAKLVHFSTDYVFGLDATRKTPYREHDAPGPVSVYGMSKLAGEYAVRSASPRNLVIRTCGLYGRWGTGGKGGNFIETMLRLASQGKHITVVDDQILTPTSTAEVAVGTIGLLSCDFQGLCHLTCGGSCSWFEFAGSIFSLAGIHADLAPISSSAYGSKARRPAYSVLTSEYEQTPVLCPWEEALATYLRERSHLAKQS
jgi:dTDP-4-dehydrorhamnose reductase